MFNDFIYIIYYLIFIGIKISLGHYPPLPFAITVATFVVMAASVFVTGIREGEGAVLFTAFHAGLIGATIAYQFPHCPVATVLYWVLVLWLC